MDAAQHGVAEAADNGRRGRRRRKKAGDNDAGDGVLARGAVSSIARVDGRCAAAKRRPRGTPAALDSRPRRLVQAPSRTTPIQRVLDVCEAAFKGPGTVPSPADVLALRSLLDSLRAEDVGVMDDPSFFFSVTDVGGTTPGITCMSIAKCDNFSVCVFFLPATSVMPLHDHPGMTVFSRLLAGSMHVKAYDWVDVAAQESADRVSSASPVHEKLAKVVVDAELAAPCRTSVLYPASGGNMHAFTALTPCAVLDVLGPSYSAVDGRDCSYYKARPCCGHVGGSAAAPAVTNERHAWLEEVEPPQGLTIPVVQYTAPPIL